MSKLLAVLVAIFAAAWFTTPAFAQDDGTYIQICKASTSAALTGPFAFSVESADPADHTVTVGTCSPAIAVTPEDGMVTISEAAHPWFKIAALDYRDTKGALHVVAADKLPAYDADATAYDMQIPVKPGTTIVHVTNDPVMGTLEVCKYAQSGTNANGTFAFAISSPEDGWMTNLPAPSNVSVTIGSCSSPISVPAGDTIVTELKTNGQLFVTRIDVTPWSRLVDRSTEDGTVQVAVPATSDKLGETKVDFYNSLATLKVCKAAGDESVIPLAPFSFTATGAAAPFLLTPTADEAVCHEVGQFAPGALVTVTEAATPGTAVSDISLNQGFVTDPTALFRDTVNPGMRTASFYMRPGVDEITFTNDPAASVPLKVCKLPGTLTGTYSFTTSGLTGYEKPFWGLKPDDVKNMKVSTTFTVIPGQCTWVGYFPYNGTITITEASGNLVDVAVDPASSTAVILSKDVVARSASVLLGSYDTWDQCRFEDLFPAIVNFTNAPAAVAPAPSPAPVTAPVPVAATDPSAGVVSTAPPTKVTTPAKTLTVASARIVSVGQGRYVVVRVNGTAKTARVHVTLLGKNGKVLRSVTRYVPTNKAARVGNLRLGKSVVSVRVSL